MRGVPQLDAYLDRVTQESVCSECQKSIEEKVNSAGQGVLKEHFFGHVYKDSSGLEHWHIRCLDCDLKVPGQELNKCNSCTSDFISRQSDGRRLEFIVDVSSRDVEIGEAPPPPLPPPPFSYTQKFREILLFPVRGSAMLINRIIPQGGIVEGIRLGAGAFASSMFLAKVLSYTKAEVVERDTRFYKYSLGFGILAATAALHMPTIQTSRKRFSPERAARTVAGIALGTLGASLAWTALRAEYLQLTGKLLDIKAKAAEVVVEAAEAEEAAEVVVEAVVEAGSELLRQLFLTATVAPLALLHIGRFLIFRE